MVPDHQTARKVLVASPRGFCAGVRRAVDVVDQLLALVPPPIYVRREIVHNRAVVDSFRARGVIFVDELDQVPDGSLVVFSAHGVAPSVWDEARARGLRVIDATCPLVTKVHRQISRDAAAGLSIILMGHAGHDEVLGAMGEAPGAIHLVTSAEDVERLELPPDAPVACVTQTTLGIDETRGIIAALRARFPGLVLPDRSDICYATQNRQDAVKDLVSRGITHLLVVGSPNSSNSQRLCEVARRLDVAASLILGAGELDLAELRRNALIGLTAGASAPEHLVAGVRERLEKEGWLLEEVITLQENVVFKPPAELAKLKFS